MTHPAVLLFNDETANIAAQSKHIHTDGQTAGQKDAPRQYTPETGCPSQPCIVEEDYYLGESLF